MKTKIFPLVVVLIGSVQVATAQVDYSPRFLQLLQHAQMDFYEPVEARYKDIPVWKEAAQYQAYDFAIRSRKEALEIRYVIFPFDKKSPVFQAPGVECTRVTMHLASNDEDALISALGIGEEELEESYNADWGKIFFFQPKKSFSQRKHCKMLALYAEGKGMAFIFFLFDEPSKELNNPFLTLRFQEDESH